MVTSRGAGGGDHLHVPGGQGGQAGSFRSWKRAGVADVLTKHVVKPSDVEVTENPPSRSAKLRARRRIGFEGKGLSEEHMATLANIFNRFTVAGAAEADNSRAAAASEDYRLRALPNEDVYFFVKRIDNSRVIRQADPEDRAQGRTGCCSAEPWRRRCSSAPCCRARTASSPAISSTSCRPRTSGSSMRRRRSNSKKPAWSASSACRHWPLDSKFQEPTPERVVYLQPKEDGSLALNRQ